MTTTFSVCALFLRASLALDATSESYFGAHTQAPAFADEGLADADLAPGLAVTDVIENSPASAAGLGVGDRVLRVNGEAPRTPQHFEAIIAAHAVGSKLQIAVRRGVEVIEIETRTVARLEPRAAPDVRQFVEGVKLGLALVTLTAEESKTAGAGPGDGVRVRRLLEGSPCTGVLQSGDVILALNGMAVHGAGDFLAILRTIGAGEEARLGFLRSGQALGATLRARVPESHLTQFHFPLVVIYRDDRKKDETTFGVLLNIFKYTRDENRRTYRLFWIFNITTGTNEELEEVSE